MHIRHLQYALDGLMDPGYTGEFSRQLRTLRKRIIREGDVIGYGRVIYFPTGVERAYGSKGLGSHYQKGERKVGPK